MSSDAVKRRGRAKKAATLEEEVIVIEQRAISKPKKSKPQKQSVKDTDEALKSPTASTETVEVGSAFESQPKRRVNGRKLAPATTPANNRVSKQEAPSSKESAILQQATAFTPDHRQLPEPHEAEQISSERPVDVNEDGLIVARTNSTGSTQEQVPTTTSKEPEVQMAAAGLSTSESIHNLASSIASTNISTPINEEAPARVGQRSPQEPAAAMSDAGLTPLPSGEHGQAAVSDRNATAASLSLKSHRLPLAKHVTTSKASSILPSSFPPAPPSPRPLRPTELPYHELKKNPEFKALSRKYTSLMIAIPIALVTSYVLYGRYTNQTARRHVSDRAPIERNGRAKPKLLVENTADTAIPSKDTAEIATVHLDKRLLEE